MELPLELEWMFPEYEFAIMDIDTHRGVIIERVLERGDWDQTRWLFATYGEAEIRQWVQRYGFRLLSRRSFTLWRLVLDIEEFNAPDWAIVAKQATYSW